jgi:hypothetical protein
MPSPLKAHEVLNREFLEIRAKLLQLAAHFDRIERGTGDVDFDKLSLIRKALEVLSGSDVGPHRAEKLQMIFSRSYDPQWQTSLGVTPGKPGGSTNR